jgi:hypothetical protein
VRGANIAGGDFGTVPGTYGIDYTYPTKAHCAVDIASRDAPSYAPNAQCVRSGSQDVGKAGRLRCSGMGECGIGRIPISMGDLHALRDCIPRPPAHHRP